jgi:catechol 2,3-dioxygenase-like lactoylglutathione lyase family enzyme
MKRFHVHVAVPDLGESIRFYTTLFGAEPTVTKPDYAKWMLEDPRVNFAISQRAASVGINHLGLEVDSDGELETLHARLESADRDVLAEQGVHCCYATSNKYWITDPAGIAWESFHTLGSIPVFDGEEAKVSGKGEQGRGCCAPETAAQGTPKTRQAACCGS